MAFLVQTMRGVAYHDRQRLARQVALEGQVLDLSRGLPWARWCVGGTTNIVLNCIDKHEGTPVWDQTFLVWEGEDARERRTLTYHDFTQDVGGLAQALVGLGIVATGDLRRLFRDPEGRRDRDAAVLGLWPEADRDPP